MRQRIKRALLQLHYYTGGYLLLAHRYSGLGTIFCMHKLVYRKTDCLATQLTTTADFLDQFIARLKPTAEFIALDELHERLTSGRPKAGRPFVALTFDDGFRDNLTVGLPILRKHGVPATIYVSSGSPDRKLDPWPWRLEKAICERDELLLDLPGLPRRQPLRTWFEKKAAYRLLVAHVHRNIPGNSQVAEMLLPTARASDEALIAEQFVGWDELRELAADPLITIGGHGVTHASLRDLEEEDALAEIQGGRERLTEQLGVRISHFAYPYGDRSNFGGREMVLAARAGFVTGVMGGTAGNVFPEHRRHLMALPRCGLGGDDERVSTALLEFAGAPRALGSRWRNPIVTEESRD